MGAGMTATLPPASLRVGAVGGIFVVSDETKRPDEVAMRRILDRYSDSPEGIILRLAWLEGLSRKELNELTWDQVDFETQNLLLQDRTIPLEPSVADCLQKRYEKYGTVSDRVIIADRGKKPMTLVNVSRLAKNALDSEGQDVALKDLRRDWIIRQIKAHGWAYAARVSGMAVSSLRGIFAAALWKGTAQTDDSQGGGDETEYILWRIVQQEGSSAAGLAIWMCWKLAMQPGEVVNLSWSQTDFIAGVLHLPDRDVPMGNRMRRLLKETWERQKDLPTDKVFVAPTSGNPMDQSRLSVVSRTAMIRGGLEGLSLRSLSAWANAKRTDEILIQGAEERGYLVRDTAAELLNVTPRTAWEYLTRLNREGQLTKVGIRYYPVGSAIPVENQVGVLQTYLTEHGIGVVLTVFAVAGVALGFHGAVSRPRQRRLQRRRLVGVAFQRRVDLVPVVIEFLHQNAVRPRPAGQPVVGCLLACHKYLNLSFLRMLLLHNKDILHIHCCSKICVADNRHPSIPFAVEKQKSVAFCALDGPPETCYHDPENNTGRGL